MLNYSWKSSASVLQWLLVDQVSSLSLVLWKLECLLPLQTVCKIIMS